MKTINLKNIQIMKKLLFILCITLSTSFAFAQVGIGTSDPNVNAILDIASNDKGFLVSQLTDAQVATLEGSIGAAEVGMIVYNTTQDCLQIFDGTVFECVFLESGETAGNSGAVRVDIEDPVSGSGGREAAQSTTGTGPLGSDITHPSYIDLSANVGNYVPFNFALTEVELAPAPITNFPENETNPTITGIFQDDAFTVAPDGRIVGGTADSYLENASLGQVNFWRVIIYAYFDGDLSNEGHLELRIRNPQSGFVTSDTQYVPAPEGIYELSFLLITIADGASLPAPLGSGNGYYFEVLPGVANMTDIWVDSIARFSLFND